MDLGNPLGLLTGPKVNIKLLGLDLEVSAHERLLPGQLLVLPTTKVPVQLLRLDHKGIGCGVTLVTL